MNMGTKADTLKYLNSKGLSIGRLLPTEIIMSDELLTNKDEIINRIIEFSHGQMLAIRSSCSNEDGYLYSNAGLFETILNVQPDAEKIYEAMVSVYKSYNTDLNEQIIIQPMLKNIVKSGVAFTADIDTYADYYIINYYEGDDSSAVTSGSEKKLTTCVKYKKENKYTFNDKWLEKLIDSLIEIEDILGNNTLDIEFAITNESDVYILQVRPIARGHKTCNKVYDLKTELNRIYKKIKKLKTRHPFLLGDTTYYGVMPDWNPAEILGIRPKKLAVSLYKELITDSVWAHQRYDYGYRNVTSHPLMILFCGVPYIDTRITFNSFVPAKLNDKIAEKLVNYYLEKLKLYPKYHDKVEFKIVFSCYYIGLPRKLNELKNFGFNKNEITRIEYSLLDLTNKILNPEEGVYLKDLKKIEQLNVNYEKIVSSDISIIDKIYWLIEECKAYGTLPFAGIARAGFIAVQLLNSFVNENIISIDEYNQFMNSMDTITKKMNRSLVKYNNGEETKEDFLKKFGHIRPGTYDIMSPSYDEAFEQYFDYYEGNYNEALKFTDFSFTNETLLKIQDALEQNGLLVNANDAVRFIRTAIEGREYSKYIFTKCVSQILKLIEKLGNRIDISKEDIAYIDISLIKQLYSDLYTGNISDVFMENIRHNKEQYNYSLQMKLPSIIIEPEDLYRYTLLDEEPNFITQKTVTAMTVVVSQNQDMNYNNKIACIRSADPGYDYLFSKGISGLITQFGGANSHMAIRCAELGIPAVIGVGEKNYSEWSKHKALTIDCINRKIIAL